MRIAEPSTFGSAPTPTPGKHLSSGSGSLSGSGYAYTGVLNHFEGSEGYIEAWLDSTPFYLQIKTTGVRIKTTEVNI